MSTIDPKNPTIHWFVNLLMEHNVNFEVWNGITTNDGTIRRSLRVELENAPQVTINFGDKAHGELLSSFTSKVPVTPVQLIEAIRGSNISAAWKRSWTPVYNNLQGLDFFGTKAQGTGQATSLLPKKDGLNGYLIRIPRYSVNYSNPDAIAAAVETEPLMVELYTPNQHKHGESVNFEGEYIFPSSVIVTN